ncbi:uncharacterized protein LOC112055342 isoform X2 [Bicyclus anynana]|uniref:Uncharacterized protein LOC112055342 isoform X2 n=1 Tax=Bicyclus anynana TaxID=110368 RepID=A0A6J1NWU0_BICAN|nr:uncharacterized protein LOC112055342 isoform X2 [Bicyclus anynana]
MSFLNLATLAMHRRQEMEGCLNAFYEKCDNVIFDIEKLKQQARSFLDQLNCDPSELKDKFVSCMKQLVEYNYLMTDFHLALNNIDATDAVSTSITPTSDKTHKLSTPLTPTPVYLMDTPVDPKPSTSKACINGAPAEKTKKKKILKDNTLIAFSSSSCSTESVYEEAQKIDIAKSQFEAIKITKAETEQVIGRAITKNNIPEPTQPIQECQLPAQTLLQEDCTYKANITHMDGLSFWVIIEEDFNDAHQMISEMNEYYSKNRKALNLHELMSMPYCAVYSQVNQCYFRAFIIQLSESDVTVVNVYLVDVGEKCSASVSNIQPLEPRFCSKPPFARTCHFAGVDIQGCDSGPLDSFLDDFVNVPCKIKIEDNSSESMSAYVILASGELLSDIMALFGYVRLLDKHKEKEKPKTKKSVTLNEPTRENHVEDNPKRTEPNPIEDEDNPEYTDPLLAVAGYHNRDEKDICKHYKGGPEKTCFKGARCKKRHVMMHPDGWTLDRIPVTGRNCAPLSLPEPGTICRVLVVCVVHYKSFYVQFPDNNINKNEPKPQFGVLLPPTTLKDLILAMNSQSARTSYKPLRTYPAPGELVAALYPPDNQWYRAKVRSCSIPDHDLEVVYIDFGNQLYIIKLYDFFKRATVEFVASFFSAESALRSGGRIFTNSQLTCQKCL